MANTLGTANGAIIARRALTTLLEQFPFLQQITTDFSNEPVLFNQTVYTKLPSAVSAIDYNTTTGYVSADVTQVDVPVTLNKHKHVTYGMNDAERSSTPTNLIERFAGNAAQALGLQLMNDLFALLTLANYGNSSVITVAAMNRAKLVGVAKKLTGRKVPQVGRFAVLQSDYYESLMNDAVLVNNAGSPADTVRSGHLGNVAGFSVSEYYQLPQNAQSLAGFAGSAEGLILATRVPAEPQNVDQLPGSIEIVTEPNTGLSLQVRHWYDFALGRENVTFTLMYGVAVGNAAAIERMTLV